MLYNALGHMRAKNLGAGKHPDGQGLWLFKRTNVAGKWILRIVVSGKRREMGLGRWPDVSIGEARERAAAARRQVRDGIDPIVDRFKARKGVQRLTFANAVSQCFEARKADLKKDGDAGRWLSPLQVHIIPKLGKLPVEDIDQHLLVDVLTPIWHDKADSARKALNRINLTLKHAAALGLEVDLQATMKTRALLGKQRHEVVHIPSMPYSDVSAFYHSLIDMAGIAPLALRFLMLTVARTSEVRLAKPQEFLDGVWTIPAERTKSGKEHRVPLVPEAIKVIDAARELSPDEYLFASLRGRPLSDMGMAAVMKRENLVARPHGFRATFRTWVEEQTDTPFEVKESALGHAVDSDVVRAYQRSDRFERRRTLMLAWEKFLLTPVAAVGPSR